MELDKRCPKCGSDDIDYWVKGVAVAEALKYNCYKCNHEWERLVK